MGVRDCGDDRQPEPDPAAASARVAAREAFEGALLEAGRETGTLVDDMQLESVVRAGRTDRNRPIAVAQCVLDEVGERLLDA